MLWMKFCSGCSVVLQIVEDVDVVDVAHALLKQM